MRTLSLRRNFAWSLVGNTVYNLMQWLLLVALARLGSREMVGQFALTLAIAAPVYLTVGLNLRAVRATDVRQVWSPEQYHRLRLVLNSASLVLVMGIGTLTGLRGQALLVLFLVSMGKATEATSQMLYGFFQIRERMDLVSRSLLSRAFLGATGFVAGLVTTGGLPSACAGMLAGWTLTYLVHDRRQEMILRQTRVQVNHATGLAGAESGTLRSLARKAAPLGVDAGVGSLATNVPRYGIQIALGTAQLGAFAALAYLGGIVAMITGSMADTVLGRLATLADRRDARGFTRLLWKLIGFGVAVAVVTAGGAWLFGEPVIRLLLGEAYVNQQVLVLLMFGAGLITLQRCLGRGLQATHHYWGVLVVDTVTLVTTLGCAAVLIPRFGLPGAAITLGLGSMTGALVAGTQMFRVVRDMSAEGCAALSTHESINVMAAAVREPGKA